MPLPPHSPAPWTHKVVPGLGEGEIRDADGKLVAIVAGVAWGVRLDPETVAGNAAVLCEAANELFRRENAEVVRAATTDLGCRKL